MDGTLWNATRALAPAWTKTLNRHGINKTLTQKDLEGVMGKTVEEIAEIFMPCLEEDVRIKIAYEACDAEIPSLKELGGVLYPDVENTLMTLSKRYKLFIVSNCEDEYIKTFYSLHGLKKYITDEEYIGRTGKEKSENIRLVIERNSLKSPIYVGDTQGDLNASKKNSIPFIFASYGLGEACGYDAKIEKFSDLLEIDKLF